MLHSLKDHERFDQSCETLLTAHLNAVVELKVLECLDIEESSANDIYMLHDRLPTFEQLRKCLSERLAVISTADVKAISCEKEKHFSTMSFVDFCFQLYGRDGYFKKHEDKEVSDYAMQIFRRLSEYIGQGKQWQRMKHSILEILGGAPVTLTATGQQTLPHPLMEKEEASTFDPVTDRMRKLDRLREMQSLISHIESVASDHFYDRSHELFMNWMKQIVLMLNDYQAFLSGVDSELYRDWRRYHHEQPFLERSLAQISSWRNSGIISLRDRVWPDHIQSLQLTSSDLNSYQKNAFVHWSDVTEYTIFDDLMGVYNLMMRTGNSHSEPFDRDDLYHTDKLNDLLKSELASRVKDGFSPIREAMRNTVSPIYGDSETPDTTLLIRELQVGDQSKKNREGMIRLLSYTRGRPFDVRLHAWCRTVRLYENLQKDYIFVADSYRRYDEGLRNIILKAFDGEDVQAFSNIDHYRRVTVEMEVRALQWIINYFESRVDWILDNIGGHYLARANHLICCAQEYLNTHYGEANPAIANSITKNGRERNQMNVNNLKAILLAS